MREITYWLVEATERAAVAAARWGGSGQKEQADQAAVDAMRSALGGAPADIRVVIGEGEMDEAPMLYIGERLGRGGPALDLAVDPVEGTNLTANGQPGAVAVLAAAVQGSLLGAPDMYMDKICVGPRARGAIDIDRPLQDNVRAVAHALSRKTSELTAVVLDRPRHAEIIAVLRGLGVSVRLITDGDVMPAVLACLPDSGIDLAVGSGGAPEGVLAAAAIACLGGDMQGRLLSEDEQQAERARSMGHDPGRPLRLQDLCARDDAVFVASAITDGPILHGVRFRSGSVKVETLLVTADGVRTMVSWRHEP